MEGWKDGKKGKKASSILRKRKFVVSVCLCVEVCVCVCVVFLVLWCMLDSI